MEQTTPEWIIPQGEQGGNSHMAKQKILLTTHQCPLQEAEIY